MPYETKETCLSSKARAETIHESLKQSNPRSIDKRFECVAEQSETNIE